LVEALLEEIRRVIERNWDSGRSYISRILCQQWRWRQSYGQLKGWYVEILKRIHTQLKNLIEIEYEDKDCKRIVKRLRRHQHELFTFLDVVCNKNSLIHKMYHKNK